MKSSLVLVGSALAVLTCASLAPAQSPSSSENRLDGIDGSKLTRQLQERNEKIRKLSDEEQTVLRAAQQNAAQDPAVKAALEARDKAMAEFQAALVASMIKADPAVGPILERMETGTRGF